jgi:hypothetical protein
VVKHPGIFKTSLPRQKIKQPDTETLDGNVVIQSRPIATADEHEPQNVEPQTIEKDPLQLHQNPQTPGNFETPVVDRKTRRQTPGPSVQDPDHKYSNSPHSRTELEATPIPPPVTRSHARLQLQENTHV